MDLFLLPWIIWMVMKMWRNAMRIYSVICVWIGRGHLLISLDDDDFFYPCWRRISLTVFVWIFLNDVILFYCQTFILLTIVRCWIHYTCFWWVVWFNKSRFRSLQFSYTNAIDRILKCSENIRQSLLIYCIIFRWLSFMNEPKNHSSLIGSSFEIKTFFSLFSIIIRCCW